MKNSISLTFTCLLFLAVSLISCKKEKAPSIITSEITDITISSAVSGGTITDQGSGNVLTRGLCWSTGNKPSIEDNKTSTEGYLGNFTDRCYGLEPVTTYFVRAYATNSAGVGYGLAETFTTLGSVPAITLLQVTNITPTTATVSCNVSPGYLATNVYFEYGPAPSYGQSLYYTGNPLTVSTIVLVSSDLTDLIPGTQYRIRIRGENQLGNGYSQDITFETPGLPPEVITRPASEIKVASVRLACAVKPHLLPTVITYEYGTTTDYGKSVVSAASPVNGDLLYEISDVIIRLQANTSYHYRVIAQNVLGTVYGEDMSFTTLPGFTDIDGNSFDVVTIGSQIWMKENLRTTTYNDNTPIPYISDWTSWATWGSLTTPGYCNFGEDLPGYAEIYGPMYNWYAVNTGKICPTGWHVPEVAEWNILFDYLGGQSLAGNKMMETGTEHWNIPNNLATNESGFTALPGGYRDANFVGMRTEATWLTATEDGSGNAWMMELFSDGPIMVESRSKKNGSHIRCIKDN
jgi:uncharacterized protein (TIGR02145 family)